MSVKTAVIASAVGGMPEMVKQGYNGYVYEVEKPELLRHYMLDLFLNPLKSVEFGENGYKLLKEKFTWEINICKIIELYNETIKKYK